MSERLTQNEVLRDCDERFEKLGIAYMLTGSMAMTHYAMPRMTADIDVVLKIGAADVERIITEFEPDYYIPHNTARQAVSRGSMFNLLSQTKLVKIDCIVRKTDEYQVQAFAGRKRIFFADDFDVWIISREDLILSKLDWSRKAGESEKQLRDVANILRHGGDRDYLENWAQKLGVADLLEKATENLK